VAPQDLRLAAAKMEAYIAQKQAADKKATKTAIAGDRAN